VVPISSRSDRFPVLFPNGGRRGIQANHATFCTLGWQADSQQFDRLGRAHRERLSFIRTIGGMLGRLPCETLPRRGPALEGPRATRWILPATILGSSLSFIDGSVVSVALPAMQRDLATGFSSIQWVVNGYLLSLASLILLGGALGDRLGRRKMFMTGLVGFAAASLGCGLAPSVHGLIAARFVQGVAAALLMPASLAIVSGAYTGESRGRAIGTWAAAGALTTALGPMLGGWIVDAIGWRSIFFVNLPVAAAALLLAMKMPVDEGRGAGEPLDLRGTVSAVVALGLLSYGLIAVGAGATAAGTVALIATAPTLWYFVRIEQTTLAPMLPLSLFTDRTFAGANALTVLLYAALSGALFLLPYLLIEVHGYSATAAGAAFLPLSVLLGVGSRWSGGVVERTGPLLPLIIGPSITATGYLLLGLSGARSTYWTAFLPGLVVIGIGMTLSVAPLTTAIFDASPAERSGTASGINNAAARTGGLLAVAALGLILGGTTASSMQGAALSRAYAMAMFCAAGLAALGALTAALTVRLGPARPNIGSLS
jgi:EmrB/QacA subfamily drug resistance transporter